MRHEEGAHEDAHRPIGQMKKPPKPSSMVDYYGPSPDPNLRLPLLLLLLLVAVAVLLAAGIPLP